MFCLPKTGIGTQLGARHARLGMAYFLPPKNKLLSPLPLKGTALLYTPALHSS